MLTRDKALASLGATFTVGGYAYTAIVEQKMFDSRLSTSDPLI